MLWMGVQVVTWAENGLLSLGGDKAGPIGSDGLHSGCPDSYVELAVAKTADLEAVSRLRASLCTRMATSDRGNGVRYRRAVEAAYLEM
jgi:predicted O-linked N-acetylglucosamine transferase (SPINDLY family)